MNKQQRAAQKTGWANATHREGRTKLYWTWQGIKRRCFDSKNSSFKRYGGRGITMCDRWKNSYEAFRDDMGQPPTPDHTIDRIDNDKGYEPGNCRWATRKQQCRNYSRNVIYEINGKKRPFIEWLEIYKIPRYIAEQRVKKLGWTIEEALGIKPRERWASLRKS